MSGHLIGCVKDVSDLGKSHKLALVAFADSADDRTHIGFPGYEGVQAWAACSRSRAAELIADLVDAGYLHPHRSSGPGRRAEYVVFPRGCCELHRTPAPDGPPPAPTAAELVALAAAAGVDLTDDQAAAMAAAGNGSEISDPLSVNRSGISDLLTADNTNGSEISDALGQQVQNGSGISDPYTSTTTNPLTPASGGTGCPRHTDRPGASCRACGTTPRQLATAAAKARRDRRRQADEQRHREQAAAAEAARVDSTSPQARRAIDAARQVLTSQGASK